MPKRLICPNCGEPVAGHPINGCVLAALVAVLRDREKAPEAKLRKLHAGVDVNRLWARLGPLLEDIQSGALS